MKNSTTHYDHAQCTEIARRAAAESIVLLKNENATLPLPAGAAVRVANPLPWMHAGAGSAYIRCEHPVNAAEGLAAAGFAVSDEARDAAVLVVSRFSREGMDAPPEASRLTAEERAALDKFKADGVRRIIVVLNLGCGFDVAPLAADPAVGAILHAWYPGQEGGHALADILSGRVSPSGRLAATLGDPRAWPSDRTFNESVFYVPYEEDIFVGYRWFETMPGEKAKVGYPFGHGLGYTTFSTEFECNRLPAPAIECKVTVTNTGAVAGKHAVLLFSGVAGGEADHPARELRAYAKTKLLAPGESEVLALSFPWKDLAYFADEGEKAGSWVIDRGEYTLYLGGSVREARAVASFRVGEPEIVSSPGLKLVQGLLAKRARADGGETRRNVAYDGPDVSVDETKADVPAAAKKNAFVYGLGFVTPLERAELPKAAPQLFDVAKGRMTLDDFIALLTPSQQSELFLHRFNSGHSSRRICVAGSPPAAGIPPVVLENAGCGVVNRFGYSTAFPCSALVACAFDPSLGEEVGAAIGSECADLDVDLLEGPGMNIHRHPSCGRNFEYFSEDPLVAGLCAAACCKGLRRTGTLSQLKHFAANNREEYRDHYSSVISERALREIYLRAFEIAVKAANPDSIMTGYNRVNGRRCGSFHNMVQGVLRDEWGWDGVVMSDFGAKSIPWEDVAGGSDIHILGFPPDAAQDLENHVFLHHVVPAKRHRASLRRILTLVMKTRRFKAWMAQWGS